VLLSNLDLLATAPGGVARLRELILTLAVQGKLVPQDPQDEPASALLARIAQEKQRLQAAGKIKKGKPLAAIAEVEKPFGLPAGWEWARLGEITNYGATTKAGALHPDTWVLDMEDIEKSSGRLLQRVRLKQRPALSDKNCFIAGDVLYGKLRPYLNKVLVADEDGICTTEIIPFRCYGDYVPQYFRLVLSSPFFLDYVNARSYGMKMPRLGTEDARSSAVPLPPLAEQSRIVARVEALMRLCDALEDKGRLQAAQHAQLASALLGTLTASRTPEELAENWQRVARHFDLLLDRPEAVDVLEQTLLQLAVRGLLVPQDPRDEPASALLARIRAEKDQLIAEGQIKRDKPLAAIAAEEMPFELPAGWEWVRMAVVVNASEAGWSPTCIASPRREGHWGVLKVSAVSWGEFDAAANKELPSELTPRPEYEVESGDFLLSRANTAELVARSVVVRTAEPKLMLSDKIIRLDVSSLMNRDFLNLVNNANHAREHYSVNASGTSSSMKNVSREVVLALPVPLPPLLEQSRIVARVTALRRLCADLRQRLAAGQATQARLAEALVQATA